jgi:hypothetical protein
MLLFVLVDLKQHPIQECQGLAFGMKTEQSKPVA